MEEIVFKFKSLSEQFKEQYPELYDEIYYKGYREGLLDINKPINEKEEKSWLDIEDDAKLEPLDDSEAFCVIKQGNVVAKLRCLQLVQDGYTTSQLWNNYINSHDPNINYNFYIMFNPTHKEFAIGIDIYSIELMYPKLRNSRLITE